MLQFSDPYIELCIDGAGSPFRALSQDEKELLDRYHEVFFYRKGEVIVKEGGRTHGLMCIASGKAKVFRTGAGNREQVLRMLKPMNFISYRSLFSENQYPFTVTAIEESAVVIFEKHNMSGLLKQNSELAIKFIKAIAEELLFANNRLISLTQKHVRGRLAESLILLRDTYGLEADGITLKVLISREDLAHLSNMTTSNAIRTLSGFVTEGLIRLDGRRILITNPQMLGAISESGQ